MDVQVSGDEWMDHIAQFEDAESDSYFRESENTTYTDITNRLGHIVAEKIYDHDTEEEIYIVVK
jgi:hypothetical protein